MINKGSEEGATTPAPAPNQLQQQQQSRKPHKETNGLPPSSRPQSSNKPAFNNANKNGEQPSTTGTNGHSGAKGAHVKQPRSSAQQPRTGGSANTNAAPSSAAANSGVQTSASVDSLTNNNNNTAAITSNGGGDDEKRFSRYVDEQQVFVGNLNPDLSMAELRACFGTYGHVLDIRINSNNKHQTGRRLPNYGFVIFEDKQCVERLLSATNANNLTYKSDKGVEYRLNIEEKRARQGRPFGNNNNSNNKSGGGGGGNGGNRVNRSSSNRSNSANQNTNATSGTNAAKPSEKRRSEKIPRDSTFSSAEQHPQQHQQQQQQQRVSKPQQQPQAATVGGARRA